MKTTISVNHNYLSGWTSYDMVWKTDFTGTRNKTLKSVTIVSKEPLTNKSFKEWALEQGCDIESLFTDIDKLEEDAEKIRKFDNIFADKYNKNIDEIKGQNKCLVKYTATLNPKYKPLEMAFETIEAYYVEVQLEFNAGYIKAIFPSQGRQKNEYCPYIIFDGGKLKTLFGEEDAIYKVKSRIQRFIDECDSDEKFNALAKKLETVRKELVKNF